MQPPTGHSIMKPFASGLSKLPSTSLEKTAISGAQSSFWGALEETERSPHGCGSSKTSSSEVSGNRDVAISTDVPDSKEVCELAWPVEVDADFHSSGIPSHESVSDAIRDQERLLGDETVPGFAAKSKEWSGALRSADFVPLLDSTTFLELAGLTCINFGYGLICGTFALWILPAEAMRLFPQTRPLTLGVSLGLVGLAQLACPIAGRLSDMYRDSTSQFGKRKPFLFWGTFWSIVLTLLMRFSSLYYWAYSYYAFLFLGMAALNIVYSVQCGLVPDVLDPAIQGRASGLVALHTLLGSSAGFGLVMWGDGSTSGGMRRPPRPGGINDGANATNGFHYVYIVDCVLLSFCTYCAFWAAQRLELRRMELSCSFISEDNEEGPFLRPAGKGLPARGSEPTSGMSPSNGILPTENAESSLQTFDSDNRQAGRGEGSVVTGRNRSDGPYGSAAREVVCSKAGLRHGSKATVGTEWPGRPVSVFRKRLLNSQEAPCVWRLLVEPFILKSHSANNGHTDYQDFWWVFVGRTLYYVGVSVQAFMLYFLRDVLGVSNEVEAQRKVGCLALVAQLTAACIAYPVGRLTEAHARAPAKPHCLETIHHQGPYELEQSLTKKKRLIYLGCFCMSVVYFMFLLAVPIFGPTRSAYYFILGMSTLYGAGNGCFLAVDYALALTTLPPGTNVTQALGIWGVSAFIGSSLGPLLWGSVIYLGGRDPITGYYSFVGYVAALLGGVLATLASGGVICLIQPQDRSTRQPYD